MKKTKSEYIKLMTGIAIFVALTVALGFFSNYISFGQVNINLALLPIIIGACLYGPWAGLALGIIDGAVIIASPSTMSFLAYSPVATVFVCLIKTGVAGLVSGFLFKLISKKSDWAATIVASVVTPIINTGLFLVGVFLFFMPLYQTWSGETGGALVTFIVTSTIATNFFIEFATTVVLVFAIYQIIKVISKKMKANKQTALVNDETADESNDNTDIDNNNK